MRPTKYPRAICTECGKLAVLMVRGIPAFSRKTDYAIMYYHPPDYCIYKPSLYGKKDKMENRLREIVQNQRGQPMIEVECYECTQHGLLTLKQKQISSRGEPYFYYYVRHRIGKRNLDHYIPTGVDISKEYRLRKPKSLYAFEVL